MAANWLGGVAPGAADDVTIGGIGAVSPYEVAITPGSVFVHSLTLNDSKVTVYIQPQANLQATTVTLDAGVLSLLGTLSGGTLIANGGTLAGTGGTLTGVAVQGSLTASGNVILAQWCHLRRLRGYRPGYFSSPKYIWRNRNFGT